MRKVSRGLIGYIVMIAAFIFLIVLLSGGVNTVDRRIEYPALLQLIEDGKVDRVSIRNITLVGRLKDSRVSKSDYPNRAYDFETTIGPDFYDTVLTMAANKAGKSVDQVSVKEVMSEPDSAGVQHVKERITTTTHHHLESSAGSQEDTSTILKEKTDSVGTEENHNAAYTEQKKTVAGKVDGIMPWYVYLAAIIAAVVIGFVLARKKGWFAIKA